MFISSNSILFLFRELSWHFHGLLAFHDSLQFHRALDPNQPLLVKFHRMPVQERLLVQCPAVICSAWWPRLYKCQTKIAWPSWPLFMTASPSMSFCRLAKIISCRTSKRPSVALCGSTQRKKKVTQRNKTSMVSEANRTGGKLRQRRRKEQGWPSIANNCQAVVSSAKKCLHRCLLSRRHHQCCRRRPQQVSSWVSSWVSSVFTAALDNMPTAYASSKPVPQLSEAAGG